MPVYKSCLVLVCELRLTIEQALEFFTSQFWFYLNSNDQGRAGQYVPAPLRNFTIWLSCACSLHSLHLGTSSVSLAFTSCCHEYYENAALLNERFTLYLNRHIRILRRGDVHRRLIVHNPTTTFSFPLLHQWPLAKKNHHASCMSSPTQ